MISRDDWLNAVKDAGLARPACDPLALSMQEFAALTNVCRETATNHMRRLMALGKATKTAKVIMRGDGRAITVTAYRLVQEQTHAPTRTRRRR